VIAQDPFFVRRHEFFERTPHMIYWPQTAQRTYNQEAGSFIGGVVFQLGMMAGKMGLTQVQADKSFSGHNAVEALTLTQIAGLRSLPWARLKQSDVHALGMRLRFGRELVAVALLRPSMAGELAELTIGLIGPVRRTQLLKSLAEHNADSALKLLSSSDLYFLAERYWQRHGSKELGQTPLADALQSIEKQNPRVGTRYLGGVHPKTYGCLHNHLLPLSPYEEYENFKFPDQMSERLGHFMIDLAEGMDRFGIPVEALAVIGDPAIRELGQKARMNDRDDWMAALEGISQVRIPQLILAVQK
jgi:hypothetical protein